MSSKLAVEGLGGDLVVERFHDGEQVAIERNVGAGGGL